MKSKLIVVTAFLVSSVSIANVKNKLENLGLKEHICDVTYSPGTSPTVRYTRQFMVYANDEIDATKLQLLKLNAQLSKNRSFPQQVLVSLNFDLKSTEILQDINCTRR